jgi:hypothetical protein
LPDVSRLSGPGATGKATEPAIEDETAPPDAVSAAGHQSKVPSASHADQDILRQVLNSHPEPERASPVSEMIEYLRAQGSHSATLHSTVGHAALGASLAHAAVPPDAAAPVEQGQYVNYARVEQSVPAIYSEPQMPPPPPASSASSPELWLDRFAALWRRAPLLVLLVGWLCAGIVLASAAPRLWVTGFLALIGFQFVVTVFRR